MSFWGGGSTTYVSSVIYPIGEELDKIPDIVKASVIGAGMKGTSRTYAIKKSIIDGQGIKLRQAYAYAKNSYYAGLPQGIPQIVNAADSSVLDMLVTDWLRIVYPSTPFVVNDATVEMTSNFDAILKQQIETKYKYDFFEDEVHTTVFDLPVGSTLSYTALQDDPVGHPEQYGWELTFTKPDTTTAVFQEWYAWSLFAGQQLVQNRVFAAVSVDGAPSITKSYAQGDGFTPLDLFIKNATQYTSTTFPAIVLKKDNKYLDTNKFYTDSIQPADWYKDQPAYKTSKIYGRRLGVRVDQLINTVRDNESADDIDYCFVQPGTLISSPTLAAAEYHYNYFNRLRLQFDDSKAEWDAWKASVGSGPVSAADAKRAPARVVHIFDPDDETHTVNMKIIWRYMEYEEKTGTLTKPYEVECGPKAAFTVRFFSGRGGNTFEYDYTSLFLRKRLTDTTYAQIHIVGLRHENYVYDGKSVKSGVWEMFNDPESDYGTGFLIPLDYEIYSSLSAREQLQLSQEALHLVFNCYKVVKEKWYQTGIFKVVLIIVSIVVIVISWGSLSPYVTALYGSIYGSLGGLITAGIITATVAAAIAAVLVALVIVGVMVAVNLIAREAGEWAAENWGPAWGAVVQIGVTILLTWGIGQIGGAYLGVQTTPMTVVQQVAMASSYIFSGLSTYTQYEMERIYKETQEFTALVEDPNNPMKQLEALWEENFPEMSLPAQIWFAPMEKPNEWLVRTQSTGDALIYRLIAPIEYLSEMTLTPQLR